MSSSLLTVARLLTLTVALHFGLHATVARGQGAPTVVRTCGLVNPVPRPCQSTVDITTLTSVYFEIVVPSSNAPADAVDPASVTAQLEWAGGGPEPMLLAGQVAAPGWTVQPNGPFTQGTTTGYGFYLRRQAALAALTQYTVRVSATTLSGIPLAPGDVLWRFTTRGVIADPSVAFSIDMAQPPLTWPGRWFGGLVKPNFNTSVLFDQEPVYALMDAARAEVPEFLLNQRDWPLMSDYWAGGGYFDGNPNIMRERETRRITAIADGAADTTLTLTDLLEGPLYGIAPGRPLSPDYAPGQRVLVCDRHKSEVATVIAVDDATSTMRVNLLTNPAASWEMDYPFSQPADSPATPDNFSYPLGALRKFDPVGTPVYYWRRLDDEWDRHVAHGRKPIVNFDGVPFDACRIGYADPAGGSCADLPKSWAEWDDIVRAVIDHLLTRYGPEVATWRFSIGNEPDLSIFWAATDDEFQAFYDYTASSISRAFEDAGIDSNLVVLGGVEAAGLSRTYTDHILHHASPTSVDPAPGFEERNHACIDPAFDARLSARVRAICAANGNLGTPLDFISKHAYKRASAAADSLIDVRARSLTFDPVTFDRLRIYSHETTPDWIPRRDPASRDMYRWGGYFPTWGADYFRRLLDAGALDERYLGGECTVTVWPFNTNFGGVTAIAGQLVIDEDGDTVRDRVDAVPMSFFHFVRFANGMSHDVRPIGTITRAGLSISGWRSVEPFGDKILLYAHDENDTGGEETEQFPVPLSLQNPRHAIVDVTEYRLDRGHPAWAALAALPPPGAGGVYSPAQVAALEAAAATVEPVGPPIRVTASPQLDLRPLLRSQGVVLLVIRPLDADDDLIYDPDDNCVGVANPAQDDTDADGMGDACDCAPLDPTNAPPTGETTLMVSGAGQLTWSAVSGATSHDVFRESEWRGRAGGAPDATCLGSSLATLAFDDLAPLPGGVLAWRYLVRARNPCGEAGYGVASDGVTRAVSACP